jgi:hypothetical protein
MIRTLTTMAVLALCLIAAASGAVAAGREAQAMPFTDSVKQQVMHATKEIVTITPHLKKAVAAGIKKDNIKLNKAERQEVNREMDDLSKAATALESSIAGNRPSIDEAKRVVAQAKEIGEMLALRKLNGGEPWTTIMSHVEVLTRAYKL